MWVELNSVVPCVKSIQHNKLMHQQALQLVRFLCIEVSKLDYPTATSFFGLPMVLGATLGNSVIVEEILESFPSAILSRNHEGRNIFLLAVANRRENIFNLLYQMSEHKQLAMQLRDVKNNNILHLAGKLAPPSQLNLVSGAALQMQRELQWYKEVEKYVLPEFKDTRNSNGRTPAVEFSVEHKDLVKEGEQWMKDTANSCTDSFCSSHYCTRRQQWRFWFPYFLQRCSVQYICHFRCSFTLLLHCFPFDVLVHPYCSLCRK